MKFWEAVTFNLTVMYIRLGFPVIEEFCGVVTAQMFDGTRVYSVLSFKI